MLYRTMVLELLHQRREMQEQLRRTRTLLPALERYARELKTSHEVWKELLSQVKPGNDQSQIENAALEMALKELENRLPSGPRPDEAAPQVVATSAPREKAETKPLGFEEERVKLQTLKEARATLTKALPGTGPRVLVVIEGISAEMAPGFVYRVYVNLPQGERAEDVLRRHYIGSINFFGKTRREQRAAGHKHGSDDFSARFDATRALARLRRQGQELAPDDLAVTILPAVSTPPGRSPEQVRAQATAAAKEAKVSYKRISIQVIGGE